MIRRWSEIRFPLKQILYEAFGFYSGVQKDPKTKWFFFLSKVWSNICVPNVQKYFSTKVDLHHMLKENIENWKKNSNVIFAPLHLMRKRHMWCTCQRLSSSHFFTISESTNLQKKRKFTKNFLCFVFLQGRSFSQGQLISEWLFDVLNFPKKTTQKFDEFLP